MRENCFWGNLPKEMQARDQWCIAGPDKAPHLNGSNGMYRTSPVEGPWYSFAHACEIAHAIDAEIGYIITQDDPFTCIDLDIKDAESKDKHGNPYPEHMWTQREQLDWYSGIVMAAKTYSEFSTSTKGLHVWVYGNIGDGKKSNGIEVYSQSRFIVCTGNPVSELHYRVLNGVSIPQVGARVAQPIQERDRLLGGLLNSLSTDTGLKVELEEVDSGIHDNEILRRAGEAVNAGKFIPLFQGKWKDMHFPSQSEADLALMSMFTFYTQSNEQCRRLFRMSELGKRDKAVKDDVYLDRTLRLVRTRQAQEVKNEVKIDLEAIELQQRVRKENKAERAANLVQQIQKDKMQEVKNAISAPLPTVEGMEWPPGLVGAISAFIYNSAPRPVKEVAITAALGLMAGIVGKCYHISQSGLNTYIILVARSAIGKEAMHSGISLVIANTIGRVKTISRFVDFNDFASGPALVKACATNRSFVNVSGEWGQKLKRLSLSEGKDGAMQSLRTVMTNLYQKSGPDAIVGGMAYADSEKNVKAVNGVAYSMIGETTPGTFYDSLTSSMMEDGFLSRFTIIEYHGDRPASNDNQVKTMDDTLAQAIASITIECTKMLDCNVNKEVLMDNESSVLLKTFDLKCDNEIRSAGGDESIRQMWNRAHLKACRFAALLAVSDNYVQPMVNMGHAQWAMKLVLKDIELMSSRIGEGDIGQDDHSRFKKLLSLAKDFLLGNVSPSYKIPQRMIDDGVIPRKFLQQRTAQLSSFSKFRLGATLALDHAIKSAIDSGYLIEIDKNKLHEAYSFHGRCFRILSIPD